MRTCVICGVGINRPHGRQKTCGDVCSHALKRMRENQRRAARTTLIACVICEASFRPRGPQKTCSRECSRENQRRNNAGRDREVHRELCRDWRRRHPDRQAASTKRWEANNPEKVRERGRINSQKWRDRNPGLKAAQSREFRAKYPEKSREYCSKRTAAYQLVRQIEQHGIEALSPAFMPPEPSPHSQKAREAARRWRERNPDYKSPKRSREKQRVSQRKHNARETAALKLIREIEANGLEALL